MSLFLEIVEAPRKKYLRRLVASHVPDILPASSPAVMEDPGRGDRASLDVADHRAGPFRGAVDAVAYAGVHRPEACDEGDHSVHGQGLPVVRAVVHSYAKDGAVAVVRVGWGVALRAVPAALASACAARDGVPVAGVNDDPELRACARPVPAPDPHGAEAVEAPFGMDCAVKATVPGSGRVVPSGSVPAVAASGCSAALGWPSSHDTAPLLAHSIVSPTIIDRTMDTR